MEIVKWKKVMKLHFRPYSLKYKGGFFLILSRASLYFNPFILSLEDSASGCNEFDQ